MSRGHGTLRLMPATVGLHRCSRHREDSHLLDMPGRYIPIEVFGIRSLQVPELRREVVGRDPMVDELRYQNHET